MSSTIQTKNSSTTGNTPTGLAAGELAVNTTDAKMWVGTGSSSVLLVNESGLVSLSPGVSTRNWIQATGNYTTLALQLQTSQTANLLEFYDATGSPLGWIAPNCAAYFPILGVGGTNSNYILTVGSATTNRTLYCYNTNATGTNYSGWFSSSGSGATLNEGLYAIAQGGLTNIAFSCSVISTVNDLAIYTLGKVLFAGNMDVVQLSIKANTTQTNHLQEWQNSSGTPLSFVSAAGAISSVAPMTLGSNHITFGSAAPTTGTWVQGDVCFNTGVTATTSPGWSCTTGGTPGTWTAWPVL